MLSVTASCISFVGPNIVDDLCTGVWRLAKPARQKIHMINMQQMSTSCKATTHTQRYQTWNQKSAHLPWPLNQQWATLQNTAERSHQQHRRDQVLTTSLSSTTTSTN